MRRLSVREIILIYTAILLAVFSGGHYLLLLPAKEACQEAEARYVKASESQMISESLLGMEKELEEKVREGKAYNPAEAEELAPSMNAIELETETLKLMENHSLLPSSVSVEYTVIVEEENKKQNGGAARLEPALKKGSVYVLASGTWKDFFLLMDEFKKQPGTCVSSFGLSERYDVDRKLLSSPEGGTYDIQFTVEYYMPNDQPEIPKLASSNSWDFRQNEIFLPSTASNDLQSHKKTMQRRMDAKCGNASRGGDHEKK